MVFTLHRYIFRELLKIFVLATLALTLMLSLGSILRPVQEYGAGPQQVLYLIGYFLPITLTFVLPMAALFAASLVYGRFAADNELDACRASGVSLLSLVYPGLSLAIMVAIGNLILSFYVMPVFIHRAEISLRADAKQILFRNIQRKGYYKIPSEKNHEYRVYADMVDSQNGILSGVVIAELKDCRIKQTIAAQSAVVHFNPHDRFNEVHINASKVYQIGSEEQGGFFFEKLPVAAEFGSLLADDIKFKKIDEMKKIRVEPMRFYPIAKLARQACAQLTTELLAQNIAEKITAEPDSLYKLHSYRRVVEFTVAGCGLSSDEREVELAGPVKLLEYDAGKRELLRTLRAPKGTLYIEGDELAPTITMELDKPVWQLADGRSGMAAIRLRMRGLVLPEVVTNGIRTSNLLEAVGTDAVSSALRRGPSPKLAGLQAALQRKIDKTLVEIKAEMHSRLVFGIGCVSMIMIGIGLGIMLKDGHLLSAFGASSVPAAVLIVCIMAGKNVTKNPGVKFGSGVVLMWSGLALLCLLVGLLYRRLLRH